MCNKLKIYAHMHTNGSQIQNEENEKPCVCDVLFNQGRD